MTYISRRTRISDSRWLDEGDAEYTLRVARKRSDGRLKRHSSCDDLRAWINNNCIKHEYLVDLMSDGEIVKKSHIRLFGRFIPVPVLVDVLKNAQPTDKVQEPKEDHESEEMELRMGFGSSEEILNDDQKKDSEEVKSEPSSDEKVAPLTMDEEPEEEPEEETKEEPEEESEEEPEEESEEEPEKEPSPETDNKEKQLLEEMLCECMSLLCRAVGKLERIDTIVGLAQGDFENARNEEIQGGLQKSKTCFIEFIPSKTNDDCPSVTFCRKKMRDSAKNKELLRKISGLREKLKKIQECQKEINEQIFMSQQRVDRHCTSSIQVTELYNREEQAFVKQLETNLERLTAEKGRLLCEMCHALNSLNSLKKSSKMSVCSQKKSSRTMENSRYEDTRQSLSCTCGCQLSDNFESSESDRLFNSHSSAESYLNECSNRWRRANNRHVPTNLNPINCPTRNSFCRPTKENRTEETSAFVSVEFSSPRNENVRINIPRRNVYSESSTFRNKSARTVNTRDCDCLRSSSFKEETMKRSQSKERFNSVSAPGFYKRSSQNHQTKIPCCAEETSEEQRNASKPVRRSNLKIVCPQSNKRKGQCGSMINFKVCFCSDNKDVGSVRSNAEVPRPNTSPTTNEERFRKTNYQTSKDELREYVPERKIKSETTMQEVEKALRNYEERLNGVCCLENRVEELRQRLSEARYCRKQLAKHAAEVKRARVTEAEKSANETTRLSSENWELKRQIHQLAKKFEMQCKKIENLKSNLRRASELELEAETLRRELLGYRGNFYQQQKCITRLHSVVAVQRTEIENLMDHIRRLTAMREQASVTSYPERKNAQKSRSYSPDSGKNKRMLKTKIQGIRGSRDSGGMKRPSDEECAPCFCPDNQLWRSLQPPVEVIHCYPPQVDQTY